MIILRCFLHDGWTTRIVYGPIDTATIIESVKKTSRLACVYEGVKTLGIGAEISARIAESADAYKVRFTRAEWYAILVASLGENLP
jgi:predicted oxidoreductase